MMAISLMSRIISSPEKKKQPGTVPVNDYDSYRHHEKTFVVFGSVTARKPLTELSGSSIRDAA
jgi:hypothetical protein